MRTSLVVTSIHAPNAALRELAAGCVKHGWDFVVAGDSKSPPDFHLDGCRFLSLENQRATGFTLAGKAPQRSYTRKNIGYLSAMREGADVIVETDDDNHPMNGFWNERHETIDCRPVEARSWVNAYRYFASGFIYPRGLPLAHARDDVPAAGGPAAHPCPVQQGLADADPDVDAIYRMLFPLPFHFDKLHDPVLLLDGAWCPFNSQNTTFFKSAFPLLYLPAMCSFRMTDIWRGFVAQRVLHALGHGVAFHAPTVWQERNDHDLHRDFTEELPGLLNNAEIRETLTTLALDPRDSVQQLMERCYQAMIRHGWVGSGEEQLLQAWFDDLRNLDMI